MGIWIYLVQAVVVQAVVVVTVKKEKTVAMVRTTVEHNTRAYIRAQQLKLFDPFCPCVTRTFSSMP